MPDRTAPDRPTAPETGVEARDVLRMFREYRYAVGKAIHDSGGYKGLADNLGPLGDSIEAVLAAAAPPAEPEGPTMTDRDEVMGALAVAAPLLDWMAAAERNEIHPPLSPKKPSVALEVSLPPAEPEGLDVERLARALLELATRDDPLQADEVIVSIALEPNDPDIMAGDIAAAYAALLPPTAAGDGLVRSGDAATGLDARMLRWVAEQPVGFGDWACVDCRPDSDMLVAGFRCMVHEARARLARRSPE